MTASYTPQQNGLVECKNHIIVEMARSILKAKGLENTFWAEAIAISVYFLNRCPTKSVKNMTPYEAWHGRKPGIAHLRVFGCIAYAHIPEQKGKSLMTKVRNASSLAIMRRQRIIVCIIR